ncbi:MAG: hypothetical protein NT018_07405 [Armatimonadetes bacterium]|nr:hypothetical protein [Armatimonadota bacterium]
MKTVRKLFDIFSANLGLYREDHSERFMCPLCLRTFSVNQINNDLSKAHIIPQVLNGKEWTLACGTCNNKVGSEIESCEAERVNYHLALSGKSNKVIRAKLIFSNKDGNTIGPVQADMRIKDCDENQRLQLFVKQKGSNPEAWELHNNISCGKTPAGQWKQEVHYCGTRSLKCAQLTYVHAAYLFMFHQFGYEWIFSPGAEIIRKQIMSPDEPIFAPLAPALAGLPISKDKLTLILVNEPVDFRSFLVMLPQFPGWSKHQGVWMPLFGSEYKQPPQRRVDLSVASVPDHHQFLQEPGSYLQGSRFIRDKFVCGEV